MAQNFTSIEDLVKKHHEMRQASGSVSKEFGISSPSPEINSLELPIEEEESSEGVEEYITPHPETIQLPPDLKKVGVQATNDDTQFKSALYKLKLPISDEKIMDDLKASPAEAKRWYATILLYMLKMAHLTLKKVGSKVVRAFNTS